MATSLFRVLPHRSPSFEPIRTRLAVPPSPRASEGRVREHVLGQRLFGDALLRARQRADRCDQPFAVLIVDRGASAPDRAQWVGILRAVAAVKREIDVAGWLEHGAVLGLLLPEAPSKATDELMRRLRREIARRLGDAALAVISIRLYAHRGLPASDGEPVAPADLLVEPLVRPRAHPWRDAAKRGLDIVGSVLLLGMFGAVLLGIVVAVKWTSPGPAFFRQVRVGRRGEHFTMLKFRTMHVGAPPAIHQEYATWFIKSSGQQPRTGNEIFKLTNDPRITRVGHFLRKTSLDELPQFWNVLRGDMSLVGPRPPLPFEVEQYQSWHRRRVLDAQPGVTGPWQVNGRSRTTFDEMVRLDLRYAKTHSLWTDIKILAATPRAMVSGKGAC